ncbi:hypothetical protein ACO0SA_000266 [Hanseniaspora valbyensis]
MSTNNNNTVAEYPYVDKNDIDKFSDNELDDKFDSSSFTSSNLTSKNIIDNHGITPITKASSIQKNNYPFFTSFVLWFSSNSSVPIVSMGTLGPILFGLNFKVCCILIILTNFFCAIPVAYFATFGKQFGLRQLILSRFINGYYCARMFLVFQLIACIGWVAGVNVPAAANCLAMVNAGDHSIPKWASCIIILAVSFVVSFFGVNFLQRFELFSSVLNYVCVFALIARIKLSGEFSVGENTGDSKTIAGNCLSYLAILISFNIAWASYGSDYTIYMNKKTNSWRIAFGVFLGLFISLSFVTIVGAACASCIHGKIADSYSIHGFGGLLYAILIPSATETNFNSHLNIFMNILLTWLSLSVISINIPNFYSFSICCQAIHKFFERFERQWYTLIAFIISVGISIAAVETSFKTFMSDMMDGIGYFAVLFTFITLSEIIVFRRFDLSFIKPEDYDTKSKLPVGLAGIAAFVLNIPLVAMGMNQSYWVGYISRKCGGADGGDVAMEITGACSFLIYIPLRYFENKWRPYPVKTDD